MANETTTLITIDDVQAGKITERTINHGAVPQIAIDPFAPLREAVMKTAITTGKMNNLLEAFVNAPDAASMLRTGIRYLAFTAYGERERSFTPFTTVFPSSDPQEEYLRDAGLGTLPKVVSGAPAPMLISGFDGGVLVKNDRHAGMIEVTRDDLRFAKFNKLNQIAPELGIAAVNTLEAEIYAAITNPNNFTRNSTTGDNDIGANTSALTLSGLGLEQAYTIISTMRDRKSGSPLGLLPDTLICGPRNKWSVMQLLMADQFSRNSNASEVRGTGTTPIYRGLIKNIVISSWFPTTTSGYQWALCDSSRLGLVLQEVEAFNVIQESMDASSEAFLVRDSTRYLGQMYFGVGLVDDRPWFYSSSTTAATIS